MRAVSASGQRNVGYRLLEAVTLDHIEATIPLTIAA
jgi:hypothetical protein